MICSILDFTFDDIIKELLISEIEYQLEFEYSQLF